MTLRSLMIGDTDHYLSPYIHGIAAASGKLGILHSQISIRQPVAVILQRVLDVQPHVLWTHMLLWGPEGSPPPAALLQVCRLARQRFGTKVIIHDGDLKERTRWPADISAEVDLALVNHRHDRSAWGIPVLYWPYACFPQSEIAKPVPSLRCTLAFAGQLSREGAAGIYDARTAFVRTLQDRVPGMRVFDGSDGNTLLRTADLAASADAILGFGRPGTGWVDNRLLQYPGAGGIVLHDDVPDDLGMTAWRGMAKHGYQRGEYVPYESGNVDSVIAALESLQANQNLLPVLRGDAHSHGQQYHSYTARVQQVLDTLGLVV